MEVSHNQFGAQAVITSAKAGTKSTLDEEDTLGDACLEAVRKMWKIAFGT